MRVILADFINVGDAIQYPDESGKFYTAQKVTVTADGEYDVMLREIGSTRLTHASAPQAQLTEPMRPAKQEPSGMRKSLYGMAFLGIVGFLVWNSGFLGDDKQRTESVVAAPVADSVNANVAKPDLTAPLAGVGPAEPRQYLANSENVATNAFACESIYDAEIADQLWRKGLWDDANAIPRCWFLTPNDKIIFLGKVGYALRVYWLDPHNERRTLYALEQISRDVWAR